MKRIFEAFPDILPYGKACIAPSPQLTVAKCPLENLGILKAEVEAALELPTPISVSEVVVMVE